MYGRTSSIPTQLVPNHHCMQPWRPLCIAAVIWVNPGNVGPEQHQILGTRNPEHLLGTHPTKNKLFLDSVLPGVNYSSLEFGESPTISQLSYLPSYQSPSQNHGSCVLNCLSKVMVWCGFHTEHDTFRIHPNSNPHSNPNFKEHRDK